nr:hypothetical protein [[Ruminococcus] lactaris]
MLKECITTAAWDRFTSAAICSFRGLMYLMTLVFGGWLIARGQMEAADLAMYALYIGIFISPIQILVELVRK